MKTIPNYALYGETELGRLPDVLHCESIRARSLQHDWEFSPHRHHGLYQFFIWTRGGGVLTVDGVQHALAPPAVLLVPPLSVHGFSFDPGTEGWVVTVPSVTLFAALSGADQLAGRLNEPALMKGGEEAAPLFRAIAAEHAGTGEARAQALQALTGLLAIWFARAIAQSHEPAPDRADARHSLLRRFQAMLEEGFQERRPLSAYARALGVTPPHLTRVCRTVTGRPASALISERVVLEAKRRLVYTSMSVSEVAYSLGFADPAHFTKFFAAHAGGAPSAFRAEMAERADLSA